LEKLDLSLVIITQDEENNIKKCIDSVPFAKEVIVVDSGSKDKTTDIAESLGAKVFYKKWGGYGAQKDFASSLANAKWILNLDADESLSLNLANEIKNILKTADIKTTFLIPFKHIFLGKIIHFCGWRKQYRARLYSNKSARWKTEDIIHEKLLYDNKNAIKLKNYITHKTAEVLEVFVIKNIKYAISSAVLKYNKGRRINCSLYIVFACFFKFIGIYIFKLGFLDGIRGFLISVLSTNNYMIQLYEIFKKSKK